MITIMKMIKCTIVVSVQMYVLLSLSAITKISSGVTVVAMVVAMSAGIAETT